MVLYRLSIDSPRRATVRQVYSRRNEGNFLQSCGHYSACPRRKGGYPMEKPRSDETRIRHSALVTFLNKPLIFHLDSAWAIATGAWAREEMALLRRRIPRRLPSLLEYLQKQYINEIENHRYEPVLIDSLGIARTQSGPDKGGKQHKARRTAYEADTRNDLPNSGKWSK